MKKIKQPTPKKTNASPEDQEDALARNLSELAHGIARQKGRAMQADMLKQQESELRKLIRKCLYQKQDDILYEALEHAKDAGVGAYLLLKEQIEEASGTLVFRRDEGPDLEVNAFVIPLFSRTHGGLHKAQCFQDGDAFESLTQSIKEAGLEGPDARVVLVSYAYHPDEIEKVRYSRLSEMVREAFDSMTSKKMVATPTIEHSMSGWPDTQFAPDDLAVELRFLLGFAMKRLDDPFYRVPADEAAADRYFEARASRFQQWTQQVAPLVKRCLVVGDRKIDLDFLYQDLFHGGKERGIAEYDMLQMMADLHHGLQLHDTLPERVNAIIGPVDAGGEMVLRVNLHAQQDGALVASSEKPLDLIRGAQLEADDVCDALETIGVKSMMLASGFDDDGNAVGVRPYES